MTVILVLHLIVILISEIWHGTIFSTIFQSQNSLLPHSLLFAATPFFITSHLRIIYDLRVSRSSYLWLSHVLFGHTAEPLHWFPVQSRTIFKLCTSGYQILSSGEPSYLFAMLPLTPKPSSVHLVFTCCLFRDSWFFQLLSFTICKLTFSTLLILSKLSTHLMIC